MSSEKASEAPCEAPDGACRMAWKAKEWAVVKVGSAAAVGSTEPVHRYAGAGLVPETVAQEAFGFAGGFPDQGPKDFRVPRQTINVPSQRF